MSFITQNWIWLLPFALLDLTLKSIGLWRAARARQLGWFVALFIFNTAGILPIIYLNFFDKGKPRLIC